MSNIDKKREQIALLLAKAERTDNEHERDTFTAAATKLMIRLGIDRAELESVGKVKPEEIVEQTREFSGTYAISWVPFATRMARAVGDLEVLQSTNHNGMRRTLYVIGHRTDVERFFTLLDSLQAQALAGVKVWQRAHRDVRRYQTDMEKYNGTRSFIEGFGLECVERLREAKRVVREEAPVSAGAELVLASKEQKVRDEMQRLYPTTRLARTGAKTFDGSGFHAGRKAGAQADLGQKRMGSRQAIR